MEIMIESMMRAERRDFLDHSIGNKGNGYRQGKSYGQGRVLEFRIPRDRYGNFHPTILALLRDQEVECEQLASSLYCKGLKQSQVGEVFGEVYGQYYSKSSISRMIEYLRADVEQWLTRSLESYYPVLFVDAIHVKVHRKRSVESEAFYVMMGIKEDKTREVLGIFNRPRESATGWEEMFQALQERGVHKIGLLVADGIRFLEDALGRYFPNTPLQKCVTHLKRNMLNRVRHGDKGELASDLREVFRTGDRSYTEPLPLTATR
jgi:transposase-like protein